MAGLFLAWLECHAESARPQTDAAFLSLFALEENTAGYKTRLRLPAAGMALCAFIIPQSCASAQENW
jgi:hypothetical protein